VCFVTPSSYEVAVEGRKIIGSAQRRVQGVILQHGSIPISLDLEKLSSLLRPLKYPSSSVTPAAEYRTRMTSLQEVGGRPYAYAEVAAALSRGFADVWGVELIEGHLATEERRVSARLRATKYCSEAWTWRR